VEEGLAYKISDGYYFDVSKFVDYGKLSRRDSLDPNDSVSRIDENPEKKNPRDFCLWKFKKDGEPSWSSDLGDGRPGWHIEDTAITENEFGPQYDIHGGAMDLIFPHHEAEIAQMESISGKKPLARYWLHTGFLNIRSEKMSKSTGNFLTIRDVLKKVSAGTLRYFFFSSHYRSQIDFNQEALRAAENAYRKLQEIFAGLIRTNLPDDKAGGRIVESYKKEFIEALENDFNTPEALAVIWKLVKDESLSPADKRATLLDFDQVLGFDLENNEFEIGVIPEDLVKILADRERARSNKDWQKADELRHLAVENGYEILDTEEGQKIRKL
jgi:cysteinyl-tRNA synthetase